MEQSNSQQAYAEAKKYFPGGVNSPVRAFKSVDADPVFFKSAKGAKFTDLDGNTYIDYVQSWGPLILGHCHPSVEATVIETLKDGWTFGAPCELETELGALVAELIPSIEKLRFVSSGTEAAMGAIRLARGVTGKNVIVKCDGGYHGHSDGLLVSAGSGLATFGTSSSDGVPESYVKETIVIPVNDEEALLKAFENHGDQIAAFILEPVAGNIGCIPPKEGFLKRAKEICHEHKSLIIFDEVMTGFRVDMGGAQTYYDVTPDITVLGKVIGGGFPVGAYGASAELMANISPDGGIYQAGTLSGNPVAMRAGIETLWCLKNGDFQKAVVNTDMLEEGVRKLIEERKYPLSFNRVGTMFSLFFTEGPVWNYQDVSAGNIDHFKKYHKALLEKGIYIAPSAFEAGFMSSAHRVEDIQFTLKSIEEVLQTIF